jgi:hypothetical protein
MLDLDNVGAERREDLRAVRTGQRARQIEHPDALEGCESPSGRSRYRSGFPLWSAAAGLTA